MADSKYSWQIIYNDSSIFNQFNEDGTENLFGDIDQERVDKLLVFEDGKPSRFSLDVVRGKIFLGEQAVWVSDYPCRLVFFRRVRQTATFSSMLDRDIWTCFGLQSTIGDEESKRNIQLIFGINEKTGDVCYITK